MGEEAGDRGDLDINEVHNNSESPCGQDIERWAISQVRVVRKIKLRAILQESKSAWEVLMRAFCNMLVLSYLTFPLITKMKAQMASVNDTNVRVIANILEAHIRVLNDSGRLQHGVKYLT